MIGGFAIYASGKTCWLKVVSGQPGNQAELARKFFREGAADIY
jgi:hypothetical protein